MRFVNGFHSVEIVDCLVLEVEVEVEVGWRVHVLI